MVKRKRSHKRRKSYHRRSDRLLGKPIIGITCEVEKLKPYFAEFSLCCDYRYVRAIIRAGGIPLLLPINPFPRDAARMLEHIDGLVIIGGADIHPQFYGEKSKQKIQPMYRGRTYFDMWLYRSALKRKIPVLAICFGMQLLNVACGGTLHQDIKSELPKALNHRSRRNPLHLVEIQPGSILYKILRKKSIHVHSEHHQAIKLPGKNIQITAVSQDGIPEAVEGPTRTLAVQWHPERQPKDPIQSRLFRYFIKTARAEARNRIKPD